MSQIPSPHRWDAWPTNCTSKDDHASTFLYTSSTLHARYIHARFELWGRPFCLSLLASFFLLVLLWKEFIPHSFVVTFHFPPRLTIYSLSSQGRLLDSHKCRLFCLHIQHSTCCLFERRTTVSYSDGSSLQVPPFNFTLERSYFSAKDAVDIF